MKHLTTIFMALIILLVPAVVFADGEDAVDTTDNNAAVTVEQEKPAEPKQTEVQSVSKQEEHAAAAPESPEPTSESEASNNEPQTEPSSEEPPVEVADWQPVEPGENSDTNDDDYVDWNDMDIVNTPAEENNPPGLVKEPPAKSNIELAQDRVVGKKKGTRVDISDLKIPSSAKEELLAGLSFKGDAISFEEVGGYIVAIYVGDEVSKIKKESKKSVSVPMTKSSATTIEPVVEETATVEPAPAPKTEEITVSKGVEKDATPPLQGAALPGVMTTLVIAGYAAIRFLLSL